MRKTLFVLAVLLAFSAAFSQDDLKVRAMTENVIHFATNDGKVASANYWQLKLGTFEVKVARKYPGEGDIPVEGNVNVAFMSGGYLEGNGFGMRTGGITTKVTTQADFAVKRDGKYQTIRADAIDYIFYGGTKVKLKDVDHEEDLYVYIEDPYNTYHAKKFDLAIWVLSKNTGELTHSRDVVDMITAVSFTADGAKKGHQATLKEASK
jgi:hypothetical protein